MTLSNNAEQPRTSLKEELRKEIPQLFTPGFGLRHDAVADEASRMEKMWGGARMDVQPGPDLFMEIKAALQAGIRGIEALPMRLLPYVPFAMLYGEHTARDDADTLRAFLSRMHEAGRAAPRRLWPHYLLTLERDDAATNELGLWLKAHRQGLPERLMDFTEKYDALDPATAPSNMAREVLTGDGIESDFRSIGVGLERLHTAALLVEILGAAGRLLQSEARPADAVRPIRALLPAQRKCAIDETEAREPARRRARGAFIEGLIEWQRRSDPDDAKPGAVLDLVLDLNEDPRFNAVRWNGVVPKPTMEIVEAWLTKHTLEAFFRVATAIKIERRDMWEARHRFWKFYLPHVQRAWLIVGDKGVDHAKREGIRFGRFSGGASADHCGLMLDLGDLIVLEMNMMGRAILWRPNDVQRDRFPTFYDGTPFNRALLNLAVPSRETWQNGCIGLSHNPPPDGWFRKFADQIQQRSDRGIRPKGL